MLFKTLAIAALAAAPLADGFVTPFAANTAFKGNAVATRVSVHLHNFYFVSVGPGLPRACGAAPPALHVIQSRVHVAVL